MAITWLGKKEEQSGKFSLRSNKNSHTYSETYFGVDNAETEYSLTSLKNQFINAYGLRMGTPYEGDSLAVVTDLNVARKEEDGRTIEVQVEYGPGEEFDIPWKQRAVRAWGSQDFDVICDRDIQGNLVQNTAGDWFDPPLTRSVKYPVLTITQNESLASFNPVVMGCYNNAVNSNRMEGCEPETLRAVITAQETKDSTYGWFWAVNYQFLYNPEKWTRKVVSAGFRELGDDGVLRKIKINNSFVSSPWLLDANGKALPADGSGTPYWQEFHLDQKLPYIFNFRIW
jgi:hypothetical protein